MATANIKISQLPVLSTMTNAAIMPVVADGVTQQISGANLANFFGGNYSNANVTALLGNLGSAAVSTTGNITGNYIFGNGSQLTGISGLGNSFSSITMTSTPSGAANNIQYGLGNLISWNDGGWTIGEYNGNITGSEGIRINPDIEGPTDITLPATQVANTQPTSISNFQGNVVVNTGNSHQWKFDNEGTLKLPNDANFAIYGATTQFNSCANGFLGFNSYANGNNIAHLGLSSADKAVFIGIYDPDTDTDYNWQFDNTGNLILPDTANASINYANGTPYGGSSIPLEPTANGYFSTLPDFLQFVGGTLIRTGQTSEGVFFDSNAGDGNISYPVRTNFSIGGTTPVVVTVDVVVNDECSDFGLCVFESNGIQPQWAWDPNSTRIAAQYDCTQPVIYTLDDSASSGYNIPAPGTYRVRFTYDPTNAPNIILETLDTSNVVLDTLTMGGTLNTSNDYYIGFSADQDNTSLRTYIQNLTIAVGGGNTYTDSLQLSGGGANTGNVTFDNINVIGTGNLNLQPDPANSGSYLDIFLSSGPDIHIVASASANLILGKDDQSNVMTSWDGNVYIQSWDSNTNTQGGVWTFDSNGTLTTPGNLTIDSFGQITAAPNNVVSILANGVSGGFLVDYYGNTNADANTSGGEIALNGGPNVELTIGLSSDSGNGSASRVWRYNTAGQTSFPILTTQRGDTTSSTITGYTLLGGTGDYEFVLSTPNGITGIDNSQRLVINPGAGRDGTSGEGGDIYLWAGRGGSGDLANSIGGGSGGDVKIRGGQGMAGGEGGYIRIEAGNGDNQNSPGGYPGFIEITAGQGGNTAPGGYVRILAGTGDIIGGDANISAGTGLNGPGGNVNITAGGSGNGLAEYGNVYVHAGANTWTFDNTGNLVIGHGSTITEVASPVPGNYALALSGTGAVSPDQQLLVYPTSIDANHLHLTSGNLYNTELFLGNDNLYVKLANTGNIVVNANDNVGNIAQWTFGANGALSLPYGTIKTTSDYAIAIGVNAGTGGSSAVSLGSSAGANAQSFDAIAIGGQAGANTQGGGAIAIGGSAGADTQGAGAIAIGPNAGQFSQGTLAIAIGASAGYNVQASSSIVINATGNQLDAVTANTLLIDPIRNDTGNTTNALYYNTSTKEVTYGPGGGGSYGNANVADFLADFGNNVVSTTGNVTAGYFIATDSGNMLSLTTRNGDANNSNASPQITMGYAGTDNYPSFIHTTHNAGTPVDNTIKFWTSDGTQAGTFPANAVLGLTVTNGNIETGGILTDNYYYANGTPVSFGGGSYGNANVVANLAALGSNPISTTGNITGGNILASANVLGNGYARFTGTFDESQAATAGLYVGYAGGTPRMMFGTGNTSQTFEIDNDGGNLRFYQPGVTKATLTSGGVFSAAGNVTGSNLTTAGNVVFTANTGQINFNTGAYISGNANSISRDGSIVLSPYTGAGSTFPGVVIGGAGRLLSPSGSVHMIFNATDVTTQVASKINVGTAATSTTTGALQVSGGAGITGNIFAGGTANTGVSALVAGATNTLLANTVAGFTGNVNNYTQVTFQNKSTGADATADFILTADNGSDTVNYGDFGIINSGYDNTTPTNSLGNIVFAGDTYLYAQGNTSNASQSGGNLAIGTSVPGKTVKIFAGGVTNSNIVANISNTGVSVTGNVTASNFIGNISITGNVTGTSANVTLVAGSYSTVVDNTGNVTAPSTGYLQGGTLKSTNSTGNEGGELQLALAPNATISGSTVSVDSYVNRVRIFEGGGNARGVYIDLAKAPDGVGGELMWKASGFVNAGVDVTLGNLKARIPTSGNRSLQVSTVSGTYSVYGSDIWYAGTTPGGSYIDGSTPLSVTTTPTYLKATNNFSAAGYIDTWNIMDTSAGLAWRITCIIGVSYNNNMISIERLA